MGVVGGAETAGGAGATRTKGPVGGSGRDLGSGGAAAGGAAEYDGSGRAAGDGGAGSGGAGAGDSFLGPGVNTDPNGTSTVGSSGESGASGTPAAWPTGSDDGGGLGGKGGLGGEAGRCGRLQAEKGGSGPDIGGNSGSGAPDDPVPGSVWCPRGAKGRRPETRDPHASQN
jgi:hypothetical protein